MTRLLDRTLACLIRWFIKVTSRASRARPVPKKRGRRRHRPCRECCA